MLETEFESRGLSEPLLGNSLFLSEFIKNLFNVNKEAILFNEIEFLPLIVAEDRRLSVCKKTVVQNRLETDLKHPNLK